MRNSLLDLKNTLYHSKKAVVSILIYGLLTIAVICLIHSGLDRIILTSQTLKTKYNYLSIIITFFTNFIWYFLFVGAVNYADLLLRKNEANIFNFISYFRELQVLRSSIVYALIFAFLSILNTNLLKVLFLQINSQIALLILRAIYFVLPVLDIYISYRLILLPYIIVSNATFVECIKQSFRMTKKYKYTVKWFILLDAIPSILAIILFSILTPELSSIYLSLVHLHISRDAFIQGVPEIIILVFYPIKIFGYQICIQHFNNG